MNWKQNDRKTLEAKLNVLKQQKKSASKSTHTHSLDIKKNHLFRTSNKYNLQFSDVIVHFGNSTALFDGFRKFTFRTEAHLSYQLNGNRPSTCSFLRKLFERWVSFIAFLFVFSYSYSKSSETNFEGGKWWHRKLVELCMKRGRTVHFMIWIEMIHFEAKRILFMGETSVRCCWALCGHLSFENQNNNNNNKQHRQQQQHH